MQEVCMTFEFWALPLVFLPMISKSTCFNITLVIWDRVWTQLFSPLFLSSPWTSPGSLNIGSSTHAFIHSLCHDFMSFSSPFSYVSLSGTMQFQLLFERWTDQRVIQRFTVLFKHNCTTSYWPLCHNFSCALTWLIELLTLGRKKVWNPTESCKLYYWARGVVPVCGSSYFC